MFITKDYHYGCVICLQALWFGYNACLKKRKHRIISPNTMTHPGSQGLTGSGWVILFMLVHKLGPIAKEDLPIVLAAF